jgi:DNA-binding NarL/FixJ family response regulator
VRVAVADDAVLLREGVVRLLVEAAFDVVGQVGTAEDLLALVDADPPDVCVVDIRMPPTHTDEGLRAAAEIGERHPSVGVLILSQYADVAYAMQLLAQGAEGRGYLLKDRVMDVEEFADAVRRVGDGGSAIDPEIVARVVGRSRARSPIDELTDREREVLALMAEGRSNAAIERRLFLAPKTVEGNIRNIFQKLGLRPEGDDHRRVLAVLTYLRADTTVQ